MQETANRIWISYLLFQATDPIEVERLETVGAVPLIWGQLLLQRLETDAVIADSDDEDPARLPSAGVIELLGKGDADFRDGARRRTGRVCDEVLLLLVNTDGLGPSTRAGGRSEDELATGKGSGPVFLYILGQSVLVVEHLCPPTAAQEEEDADEEEGGKDEDEECCDEEEHRPIRRGSHVVTDERAMGV